MMQKSITEYEAALDLLFDKIEEACKAAGLDLKIEFEDDNLPEDEPGQWAVGLWIEGGMIRIYGGVTRMDDDRRYSKFLKWAQIEKATSIAQLPEGLADSDVRIREKAEAKRKELTDHSEIVRSLFGS